MKNDELRELTLDKKNFVWGVFYYCSKDPRVLVPCLPETWWSGWTLNFADSRWKGVLFWQLFYAMAPVLFVLFIWPKTNMGCVLGAVLACIISYFYTRAVYRSQLKDE